MFYYITPLLYYIDKENEKFKVKVLGNRLSLGCDLFLSSRELPTNFRSVSY